MGKNVKKLTAFGQRLRDCRVKRGWSQAELGERLGFKGNTAVYRLEAGESSPSIETLYGLVEILKVDLHWFITGEISEVTKRLKPFAQSHLEQIAKKMQDLRAEQADLRIQGSIGGMTSLRSDEIIGELENMRLYCQTVRKFLNEVLEPMGESL